MEQGLEATEGRQDTRPPSLGKGLRLTGRAGGLCGLGNSNPGSRGLCSVGDPLNLLSFSADISYMWPFRTREFIHECAAKEKGTRNGLVWASLFRASVSSLVK